MRKQSIFLIFILVFSLQFTIGTTNADTQPPVVNAAYVNTTSATVGDIVTYQLSISDADPIMSVYGYVYGISPDTGDFISLFNTYGEYNPDTLYYDMRFEVTQYTFNGTIFLGELYLEDEAGNYIYRYNSNYFAGYADTFQAPGVDIFGTTPDTTAPMFVSISVSKTQIFDGGDVLISVDATDDISGVDYASVDIYENTSAEVDYVGNDRYVTSVHLSANATSGTFTGTWSVSQFLPSGDYFIPFIQIVDFASNYVYYENFTGVTNQFNSPYIGVQSSASLPEIYDVAFGSSSVSNLGDQSIYINMTLGNFPLFDGYVELGYYDIYENNYHVAWLYFDSAYFDEATGILQPDVSSITGSEVPEDTPIYVNTIEFWSTEGDYLRYSNFQDFNSTSFTVTAPQEPTTDFSLELFPSSGTSEVGNTVALNGTFQNNGTSMKSGQLSVTVNGPYDSTVISDVVYDVAAASEVSFNFDITFTLSGEFTITATFTTGDGSVYSAISSWNVQENTVETPFELSISPSEGVNDVDQPVLFTVTMQNNGSNTVYGILDVTITGPLSYEVVNNRSYSILPASEARFTFEFVPQAAGDYDIHAQFYDSGSSQNYLTSAVWQVNQNDTRPPQNDHISISVDPSSGGTSEVNETVRFEAFFNSTFTQDMVDVSLMIDAYGPSETYSQELIFTLMGNTITSQEFDLTFLEVGQYNISLVLIDDIGAEWNISYLWNVQAGSDTTDTTDDQTPGNASVPQLNLPGFGFYVTLTSVFSMLAVTYNRRRYN